MKKIVRKKFLNFESRPKIAVPKFSTSLVMALAATVVIITLVTAALIATYTISSIGKITTVNVGVYTDSQCTQQCTLINWGNLNPGDVASRTIYVKNTGERPIVLSMKTEGWVPASAESYLTMVWNLEGSNIDVGDSVTGTLTMTVAAETNEVTDFTFQIIITGSD